MAPWTALTRIDLRACPEDTWRELWHFVARYEDLTLDEFAAAARDISDVYVCRHPSGAIGGVIAARIQIVRQGVRPATLVWGEWGFLDPAFRGHLVLERAMVQSVLGELLRCPLRQFYFMAEAATWNGYLALARGFARLWPRPGHPLPEALPTLVAHSALRAAPPGWRSTRRPRS
jgi:hypothetical protein